LTPLLPRPIRRGQVAVKRPSASTRNLHGQVAVEFMIYTAIFMFVAVAAFIVVTDLQRSEIPQQQNVLARETGHGFVTMMTLAMKGGKGFSYNYTFPKTMYGSPYALYLTNLTIGNFMMVEWNGSYGSFSYQYDVPRFNYKVEGACIQGGVLRSDQCSNMLMLSNDGENLTLTQLP
jgi:hypothetical protein